MIINAWFIGRMTKYRKGPKRSAMRKEARTAKDRCIVAKRLDGSRCHFGSLGTKVGLGPCHIVLDGHPAPPERGTATPTPSFRPMSTGATVARLNPLNPNGKGPQRSVAKDCKGPLGTARGRKELQRILKLVVILPHVTLIHLLAAVRKKLCATLNRACMPCYWVSKNGPSVFGGGCSPCKFIRTVKARGMNLS